ncbi:hypothetical protein E2C01_010849 [Portunus trituberculatus]|uniref:Uncharacterized protein n=1 Tax=Portunus trituberculatus TaxID=210409 RepID=A0A5B7D9H6_PORTR|nr:hypothetical protein [Portunus trituberculatus]
MKPYTQGDSLPPLTQTAVVDVVVVMVVVVVGAKGGRRSCQRSYQEHKTTMSRESYDLQMSIC